MEGSLVVNEIEMKKFLEKILQLLENDEVYIVVLTARKKYCNTLSASLEVVARDVIRNNDINKTIRKIKKLSNVEGLYVDKENRIIPNDAFVMYILPEPRSTLKAYANFCKDINNWIYEGMIGDEKHLEYFRRMDIKLFSNIHKNRSRSLYYLIDMDKKDEKMLTEEVLRILKGCDGFDVKDIRHISETRGGYHIIINRSKKNGAAVHYLTTLGFDYIETRTNMMTPIVGTLQGGVEVKEYKV